LKGAKEVGGSIYYGNLRLKTHPIAYGYQRETIPLPQYAVFHQASSDKYLTPGFDILPTPIWEATFPKPIFREVEAKCQCSYFKKRAKAE